jgi:hypothetical protein
MSDPKARLFRVVVPVRPTPKHHKYWETEFAMLQVFIMGWSIEDAGGRAWAIAKVLNFEPATTPYEVFEIADELPPEASTEQRLLDMVARWNGVSLKFDPLEPGTDLPEGVKF